MEDSQELVCEGPHGLRLEAENHQYGAPDRMFSKASKSINGAAREAIGY